MICPIERPIYERMVRIRRELHRHPELSWHETRTSGFVGEVLDELGIPHRRVMETGIVAELQGSPGVPVVALRADLDGLPIHEETGLAFASEETGVMHACGHDAHTAMVLGAAEMLRLESELPAPVRLIFQPAEEVGAGAQGMLEAGVLDGVGAIFGGHVDRHFPTGVLVIADGVVNAATDAFRIRITGQEGHAARPHEAIDAVVVGSLIVMAIQTIVSREIDPAHPSVISVGRFDAGTAHNVIAGQAILAGTIRAQDPEVREHLQRSIRRICESVAQLHQANLELSFEEGTPPLVNRHDTADLAREAGITAVGRDSVRSFIRGANMGGEDFAWYLERVPGCYIRFGARLPGREGFPAHSSRFEFDEQVLSVGAAWFHEVALVAGRALAEGRLGPEESAGRAEEIGP
jgi:hippurate hydrolase